MTTDVRERLQEGLADRYRLERELGRGGMATVYLAHDLKHDRQVALKVLHPELAATLGPERFQREIRTTARLQHPHILPVLDSGEASGQLFYTMPFVEGESLRDRLRRERQLPIAEALQITREVADALGYAHERGVVHRDIKPENILLSRGHALVADFGVARALQVSGGELTETGMSVGTPAYMSPEQGMADPNLDGRSDLYSLGCVLYEMLAGEAPYTGTSAQAIMAKRLREPVPHVRTVRETVPVTVDQSLERVLAKTPADRFASAGEFAAALIPPHSFSAQVANTALSAATTSSFMQRPNRRTLVLGGIALCMLLVTAALVYHSRRPGQASAERKMLAVLPFKNLGAATDQYFADGLTEEITSRLASVSGLGVISRTSADRYRDSAKPLKEVGRELGAHYVLEGSVRWDKAGATQSRVRVTPQLIRVSDDSHLWADRYDADLADVFQVQGNIAEQVTRALDVTLQEPERRQFAARPTSNLSAYDAYLRGNAVYPTDFTVGLDRITSGLHQAADQYREAVRLDSVFALAHAKLGETLVMLAEFGDPSTATAAKQAIEQALKLAPSLTDAHAALGLYHFAVDRDSVKALKELQVALAQRPNDAGLLATLAQVEWRTSGVSGKAIEHAEAAMKLDPQSLGSLAGLAPLYQEAQRFNDAERLYDRMIGLQADNPGPYVGKAMIHLLRGDMLGARTVIRSAAGRVDSMALITAAATNRSTWHALGMLDEPYQKALLTLRPEAFGGDTAWFALATGYTYRARGDSARFHAYYDTAYAAASVRPNDPFARGVQIWVLAGRGQRAKAYRALAELRSSSGRQILGTELEARLAVIAGDYDRALTLLAREDWGPDLTIPWLCVDHFWYPVRHDPRFQRLTKGQCRAS